MRRTSTVAIAEAPCSWRWQAGRWLVAALLLLLVTGPATAGQSPTVVEVRALYLYNFSLFISWPDAAFEAPDSPIVYCVAGNNRLRKTLAKLLEGESSRGRPLRMAGEHPAGGWAECHLLYLSGSLGSQVMEIRDALRGRPVLVVSDSETFVLEGGMVSLIRKGRRVRPMINLEAVKAAGIRISSKLLRLSRLITTSREKASP
jgi:hypothetical protein